MAKVSVVIPCYNQGAYLDEAVQSALQQSYADLEIIIVNDGSTDAFTIEQCNSYQDPRISTLNTDNQGLAAARNNGIAQATGTYILPLDADDRIAEKYLEDAVAVLDNEPDIGIVYCRARLFGAVDTDWGLPLYSLEEMLKNNVIFCSALFRKIDWELVGGYDVGMVYGWEDYDFWLSLIERNRGVKQLSGTYFFYRVSLDSMVRSKEKWQKIEMFKRIYQRHTQFIGEHIEIWIDAVLEFNEPTLTSRLYVNCGRGIDDRDSVVRHIGSSTKVINFGIESFIGRTELRFDPVDCPVCLELFALELWEGTTKYLYDLDNLGSNAFARKENVLMFDQDDPQIFIPLQEEQLQKTTEICISLEIKALGVQALRNIMMTTLIDRELSRKKKTLWQWLGLK
jgi:glycosyltransferase involved in cell wall biosynthesis